MSRPTDREKERSVTMRREGGIQMQAQ